MGKAIDKSYNGHKNWDHWNVSLWINNNEYLYFRAVDLCRKYTRGKAARILKNELSEKTPDGARYSLVAIRAALVDII